MDLNILIKNLRIRNSINVFTNIISNNINCLKFIERAEVKDIKILITTLSIIYYNSLYYLLSFEIINKSFIKLFTRYIVSSIIN